MAYIYDLTDTWNAGGTTFNGIKLNVTDSASAVSSKLMTLQTNGTEHFSVTKAGAGYFSGSVAIGITPLANTRISVRTATVTDTAYYADNGVNSGFKVKFASSLTSILNDFGADLALGTNDTERMRIDATGNIGIGTGSPSERLHVVSASNYPGYFRSSTATAGVLIGGVSSAGAVTSDSSGTPLTFGIGGTERVRIDIAGNVGIGTSSPVTRLHAASTSDGEVFRVQRLGGTNLTLLRVNMNETDNTGTIDVTAAAGNPTMVFATASTEKMRIAANGLVGVGTSAPGYRLDVNSGDTANTLNISSNSLATYSPSGYNGASARVFMRGGNSVGTFTGTQYTHGGNFEAFFGAVQNASNLADFVFQGYNGSAYAERMRIDSSGNLLVGTTATINLAKMVMQFTNSSNGMYLDETSNSSGTQYMRFSQSGTTSGSITRVGTTAAVNYNTTSDARAKHDIIDAPEASSLIDAIQVRSFKWNADNTEQRYGFVAQELVTVAPEAVSQPADPEEMMGVDYSKLVPMLVKEIQSMRLRLAQLEGN